MTGDLRCCELCGGAVTVEGNNEGTKYYIPVDRAWVDRLMEVHGANDFLLDRLRRAERIITDLRKQVSDKNEA